MKVKICGLHATDDFGFTMHPRIDYVGAVFVRESRRYITPMDAKRVKTGIHPDCRMLGVFSNQSPVNILRTLEASNADGAQLHGFETQEDCKEVRRAGYLLWKTISIDVTDDAAQIVNRVRKYAEVADVILLDAKIPKDLGSRVTGGHGIQFDWSILPNVMNELKTKNIQTPIWIAGGIRPVSVGSLLSMVHPTGIDLSSGVEVDGRKSGDKIDELLKAVDSYVS